MSDPEYKQLRVIASLLDYSQDSCCSAYVDSRNGNFVITYKSMKRLHPYGLGEMDVVIRPDGTSMFLVDDLVTNHGVLYPYENDVPTPILEAMDELGV